MRRLLRYLFGADLRALDDRLTALERAEQERERATAEQLDQLRRYWKRLQTRNGREAHDDPRTALLLRMKAREGTGT